MNRNNGQPEPNRPLVSERSPSYARSQRAWKSPPPEQANAIATLDRLAELEHTAAALCRRALPRVGSEQVKAAIQHTADEQTARASALAVAIERLGGAARSAEEANAGWLPTDEVALEYAMSDDSLLRALDHNRDAIREAYETAAKDDSLPDEIRDLLSRHASR